MGIEFLKGVKKLLGFLILSIKEVEQIGDRLEIDSEPVNILQYKLSPSNLETDPVLRS